MSRADGVACVLGLGLTLVAASGWAHGGPASVEVVAHNPAVPARMAVGTSYGLASTHDGGATWSLTCEGAIGESGASHPRVAVTSTGRLVAGLFTGPVRSDESGCSYEAVDDLAGRVTLDVQRVPGHPAALVALTRSGETFEVWRSDDDGAAWTLAASDFGPKFQARSVAASADPDRFYVGGLTSIDGFAAIMITSDGGQTFTSVIVPDITTAPQDGLFVEAVDPNDRDVVVAALYEPPSQVLVSADAGQTWTKRFEGTTVLTGLAVSPTFDTLVTGSPSLGLWRASLFAGTAEKVSEFPVRCLTWTADGLLLCADDAVTGYAVGRSSDGGQTVEPLLMLSCLQKPSCAAASQVEHACVGEWPQLVLDLGLHDCTPPPPSDAAATVATASSGAGGQGAGGAGAGGDTVRYSAFGGCTFGRRARPNNAWRPSVLLALFGLRRRRTRTSRRLPHPLGS